MFFSFVLFFNFESTFIKAKGSETRKGLGKKEQQERAQAVLCFGSLEKEVSQGGAAVSSLESQRERGPWGQVQGACLG